MTLSALQQENLALRQENERLRNRAFRDFMERAIRDDMLSRDFVAGIQQYYPRPVTPWYVCILFWGNKPSDKPMPEVSPRTSISDAFSELLREFGQPFFFESGGTVICLLNAAMDADPKESTPETGAQFCSALRDALEARYKRTGARLDISHITFSHVGLMDQGPRFLYRSAVSVSEYRSGESPSVCMETGPRIPSKEDLMQVYSLEPRFWQQIQQRSFFDAATTLDKLIELTLMEQGSLERTLASVFSRMEVVLRSTIRENGGDPLHDPEFQTMLPALTEVSSFWEMRQVCYDILATLEDRFYTPPDTRNKKMVSIEAYIQEHYANPSLSAASIAEQFKISPSYLSRIFKLDMGVGLVEYLHRIRIDAAKELLQHTDMGVEEVAARSGFSNRWSLTRVFKELEGTTPGAFRAGSNGTES